MIITTFSKISLGIIVVSLWAEMTGPISSADTGDQIWAVLVRSQGVYHLNFLNLHSKNLQCARGNFDHLSLWQAPVFFFCEHFSLDFKCANTAIVLNRYVNKNVFSILVFIPCMLSVMIL